MEEEQHIYSVAGHKNNATREHSKPIRACTQHHKPKDKENKNNHWPTTKPSASKQVRPAWNRPHQAPPPTWTKDTTRKRTTWPPATNQYSHFINCHTYIVSGPKYHGDTYTCISPVCTLTTQNHHRDGEDCEQQMTSQLLTLSPVSDRPA